MAIIFFVFLCLTLYCYSKYMYMFLLLLYPAFYWRNFIATGPVLIFLCFSISKCIILWKVQTNARYLSKGEYFAI